MKKLMSILMIGVTAVLLLTINVYGYENEIYKIDVPSDYKELGYQGSSVFSKSEDIGITIFSKKSEGLKKDFNTMTDSEVNEIIDTLFGYKTDIISKGKEKLGKSKSIKARVKSSDSYMDVYIVVSDKHILLIGFLAPSEAELDSQEFTSIKKSFKMKEKTTNTTLLRGGLLLLAGGGSVIGYIRKRR